MEGGKEEGEGRKVGGNARCSLVRLQDREGVRLSVTSCDWNPVLKLAVVLQQERGKTANLSSPADM
jgi:hypothetical protein